MNCPVCDSNNNIVFNYNCSHCICNNCFVEWNSLNNSCPVCRSDLIEENIIINEINKINEIPNNQNIIINDFYHIFIEFNNGVKNEIMNYLMDLKKILKENYCYFFDNRELINNYFLNFKNDIIININSDIFNQINLIINNIFDLLINIGLNNSTENFVLLNYIIFNTFNYIMDNIIFVVDVNEETEMNNLINDFNFLLHQNV
jgi:hypothetical protein